MSKTLMFRICAPKKYNKNGQIKPWPGMNEMIKADRTNYHVGNALKQTYTTISQIAASIAVTQHGWQTPDEPCDITLIWHEPHNRRDPDNIYGGAKFVLDGMRDAGVIKDDKQKYIHQLTNLIDVDKENPGVTVIVTAIEGDDIERESN